MSDEKAQERSGIHAEPTPAPPLTTRSRVSYFPVSLVKLVLMHFCTLGAYQYYWFYENWRVIKERESFDILPFWRTCFAVLYCFPLFGQIERSGRLLHLRQSISSFVLAGGWVLATVLSMLPDPYWLISFLSVVFLVPVQQQINRVNEQVAPGHDPNKRFTAWNIVGSSRGRRCFCSGSNRHLRRKGMTMGKREKSCSPRPRAAVRSPGPGWRRAQLLP